VQLLNCGSASAGAAAAAAVAPTATREASCLSLARGNATAGPSIFHLERSEEPWAKRKSFSKVATKKQAVTGGSARQDAEKQGGVVRRRIDFFGATNGGVARKLNPPRTLTSSPAWLAAAGRSRRGSHARLQQCQTWRRIRGNGFAVGGRSTAFGIVNGGFGGGGGEDRWENAAVVVCVPGWQSSRQEVWRVQQR